MTSPDVEEAARRIRAAMSYGKVRRPDLASELKISATVLDRWTKGTTGQWRNVTWDDLWKIADFCGVPREWFSADLERLREIVPPELPRFAISQREAGRAAAEAAREAIQRRRVRPEPAPASRPDQGATKARS